MNFLLSLIAVFFIAAPMMMALYQNNKHVKEETVDENIRYLYHGLRRLPYPAYEMGEAARCALPDLWTDPNAAGVVIRDMLNHLGLEDMPVEVEVQFQPDSTPSGICGLFVPAKDGNPTRIQLGIKQRYSKDNMLSILAHECCHALIYAKDIFKREEKANEILTDIAAVYCGFADIMKAGYGEQVVTSVLQDEDGKDYKKSTRQEIGYVSVETLEYAERRIMEELALVGQG